MLYLLVSRTGAWALARIKARPDGHGSLQPVHRRELCRSRIVPGRGLQPGACAKSLAVRCAATLVAIGICAGHRPGNRPGRRHREHRPAPRLRHRSGRSAWQPPIGGGNRGGARRGGAADGSIRLLTAAGIGVAIGAVVVNEREEEFAIEREMAELALLESHVESIPVERETDRQIVEHGSWSGNQPPSTITSI